MRVCRGALVSLNEDLCPLLHLSWNQVEHAIVHGVLLRHIKDVRAPCSRYCRCCTPASDLTNYGSRQCWSFCFGCRRLTGHDFTILREVNLCAVRSCVLDTASVSCSIVVNHNCSSFIARRFAGQDFIFRIRRTIIDTHDLVTTIAESTAVNEEGAKVSSHCPVWGIA